MAHNYRSGLERAVAKDLKAHGQSFGYETLIVPYTQPATQRRYTPDFFLPNGIIIEAKGRFTVGARQKHKMIQDCHPDLDIRFVFSRSSNTISKRSKTTYAKWCEDHGFLYADKVIPQEWMDEGPNEASIAALREIRNHRLNQ